MMKKTLIIAALAVYLIGVGVTLALYDYGPWGTFVLAPMGALLVSALVALLIYETLAISVPFLLDTFLWLSGRVLSEPSAKRLETSVLRRWARAPGFMQDSKWMKYRMARYEEGGA